ncbi:MAG TPA: ribosome small subunit-dependent GTPase A [Clostridia bacterium]|nr:ribosome small subunit-dependent GTPase A [Clostridia bacterium]
MQKGVVIKAYAGYYYVYDGEQVWECFLRGKFRHLKQSVLVGDNVLWQPDKHTDGAGNRGVIESVDPRKNNLSRPTIANVDQAVIVFSVVEPEPSMVLLDRLILLVEHSGIDPVICCNKFDLACRQENPAWLEYYGKVGYKTLLTSASTGVGLIEFKKHMVRRISVMAGPSGVGKSSILNAIIPAISLETGEISSRLKRGKHTTRHVELIPFNDKGYIADTPGFSNLNLPSELKREELQWYFPEIFSRGGECRFNGCLHDREPDCAVRLAASQGLIAEWRYKNYLDFLQEVIKQERRY